MVKSFTRKRQNKNKSIFKNKSIQTCCSVKSKHAKKCLRKSDGKTFQLPRRFTRKKCKNKKQIKGFTMRSSCAPYTDC